jgi:hypothetical protein
MTDAPFQPEIRFDWTADKDLQRIELIETDTTSGQVQRRMLDAREAACREALIELGWTPPGDQRLWDLVCKYQAYMSEDALRDLKDLALVQRNGPSGKANA